VRLRGEEYIALRTEILRRPSIGKELEALREAADDWRVKLTCEALLCRLRDPDTARKIGRQWRLSTRPPPRHSRTRRRFQPPPPLRTNNTYSTIVILCFGREAFPVVAENLLYTTHGGEQQKCEAYALANMRDPRAAEVLAFVARKSDTWSDAVRGRAVLGLRLCLGGVTARQMPNFAKSQLGIRPPDAPPLIPNSISHLARARDLPAFRLEGERRAAVLRTLEGVLADDPSELVRAVAARALEYGDAASIGPLARALENDSSTWVRAWCAAALRRFGNVEARAALRKAERETGELLRVIRGEALPKNPYWGVPNPGSGSSILERKRSSPARRPLPAAPRKAPSRPARTAPAPRPREAMPKIYQIL